MHSKLLFMLGAVCLAAAPFNSRCPLCPSSALQVLVTLQRLVHALGAESPATYPLVLPIIKFCTGGDGLRWGGRSVGAPQKSGLCGP